MTWKTGLAPHSRQLAILGQSVLVGAGAGLVVTAYRFLLKQTEDLSFQIYDYIRLHWMVIPALFLLLALAGWLIGRLVDRFPMISGSGIPQVKGVIMGYFEHRWYATLLAKFLGGAVAILGGLSLGREGPSIQLGASVAEGIGGKCSANRTEKKILIASGASAGLAAAFNAPLAGVVFSLEEVFKYFSPLILLSTMTSAVIADFIAKMAFGMHPVFDFAISGTIPLKDYWLLLILGIVLGAAGAAYNFILLHTQKLYKKIRWLSKKARPIIPFLAAGLLGLFFPVVIGSGHRMLEEFHLTAALPYLLLLLAAKFLLSMISFGSGAPGGIFFPLLVMGANIGAVFSLVVVNLFGVDSALFANFMILAMAGFFTAIVRAPITGVILLVEMTGSFSHVLSLTLVSVIAFVIAELLKSQPIYESLLENQIHERCHEVEADESVAEKQSRRAQGQLTIELVVHHGAQIENHPVRDLVIPHNCLLIAIRRGSQDLIPKGDTVIQAGDYLVCLTPVGSEPEVRTALDRHCHTS